MRVLSSRSEDDGLTNLLLGVVVVLTTIEDLIEVRVHIPILDIYYNIK